MAYLLDTVKGGDYLGRSGVRQKLGGEKPLTPCLDLEKMGLPFNRTPRGRIDQRRFGGAIPAITVRPPRHVTQLTVRAT